jgi:hypothetical protein
MVKHADVSGNEVEDGGTDAARIGSDVVSVRTGKPLEAEAGSCEAGHTASSREA